MKTRGDAPDSILMLILMLIEIGAAIHARHPWVRVSGPAFAGRHLGSGGWKIAGVHRTDDKVGDEIGQDVGATPWWDVVGCSLRCLLREATVLRITSSTSST
jgi:hypothetical protein